MSRRRWRRVIGGLLTLAVVWAVGAWLNAPDTTSGRDPRVVDGDSFILNGVAYRLDGIDAPEYRQSCTAPDGTAWACGRETRRALAALMAGRAITCDSVAEDRYGRRVARCRAGSTDLALAQVQAGWALASDDGPYLHAQRSAQAAHRGIWSGRVQTPEEWRHAHPR